jgi:hypothetical protein
MEMEQQINQNQDSSDDNPQGKSTTNDGGHENCGNDLNKLKMELIALKVFLDYLRKFSLN